MTRPRRSALFYRAVLALPLVMLGYLTWSGRFTWYWRAFTASTRRVDVPPYNEFVTGLLWLLSIAPLFFAAWEIGSQHTAARRLNYELLVGFREVLRRALGRDSAASADARAVAFTQSPSDRPIAAAALGALVAIGLPVFFASFSPDLRRPGALTWLGVMGLLMGFATYCRQRAMAYLRDEPARWDFFREWRLLNPGRYDVGGQVFVRWARVAVVIAPFWWLGGGVFIVGNVDQTHSANVPVHNARPASSESCPTPSRGIIVSLDSVAGFSSHAKLGALRQQCAAGDTALYDAVGWQGIAWAFPFAGARVLAVQSRHCFGETVHDEPADLWTAQGDSVRLADGRLLPRTLGVLRSRYGLAFVDEDTGGDDTDDPRARSCRFPYLVFTLSVNDSARLVPDSARVTGVEMTGIDSSTVRRCLAQP
jgi:hypothetical protein